MEGLCVITDEKDIVISISTIPGLAKISDEYHMYYPAVKKAFIGEKYREDNDTQSFVKYPAGLAKYTVAHDSKLVITETESISMKGSIRPQTALLHIWSKDCLSVEISSDGKLRRFNNKVCRSLADKAVKDKMEMAQVIAKLCILLLDESASIVDHIPHEDGGTYGDMIRNFNKG